MTTSSLAALSTLFRRPPGRSELAGMLELLPDPALLLDLRAATILATNGAFLELSNLPRSAIEGAPLGQLLPEVTPALLQSELSSNQTSWRTAFRPHNGRPTQIQVSHYNLNGSAYGVFLLTPPTRPASAEDQLATQRFRSLPLLVQSIQYPERIAAIQHCLQAGQLFTGATTLAYYQMDINHQEFCRKATWGLVEILPEKIPVNEFEQLRLPYTWTPGLRPLSILHRRALANQFSYLATIPVNPSAPFDAFLIVADQIAEPPQQLESMLETLAASLLTTEFHQRRLRNLELKLNRQIETMNHSESIQDMVNDGLIFVTPDLKITDLNNKAESLLGYAQDEVHGHPLDEILIIPANSLDLIKQALHSPQPLDLGHLHLVQRDGKRSLAHIRIKPYSSNGRLQRLAILITDLSQEEDFKRQTLQMQGRAELGELTAILAHEIRNPLNNISANLQVMGVSATPGSELHTQVQGMQGDLERLEHMINSTLSLGRARNYKKIPVNLNQFLEALAVRLQAAVSRRQANLHLQLPDYPIHISADRYALEQVFTNLVNNALEACKTPGNLIGIRVAPSQHTGALNTVEISVSDAGPGIPEAVLLKLFDPFFTTKSRGNGLGLAITQRIINSHNGTIEANSFPDGGTVFKIKLPMHITPPPDLRGENHESDHLDSR